MKSYIEDTSDILRMFAKENENGPQLEGSFPVSIDVVSLYTNIPLLGRTKDYKPLQFVEIYFDTATFDRIHRDVKNTLETQISVIGGTMGLLTGFKENVFLLLSV